VNCGCFGMKGQIICTASGDGSVFIWDPKSGCKTQTLRNTNGEQASSVVSLDFHQSLPMLAAGTEGSKCNVFNAETGKLIASLGGHTDSVEACAFGKLDATPAILATGALDGVLQIWDCNRMDVRCSFRHVDEDLNPVGVTRLQWHPCKNNVIVSGAVDGAIRIWDCRNGRLVGKLTGHKDTILELVAYGWDDQSGRLRLVSGSDDMSCKVWDIRIAE